MNFQHIGAISERRETVPTNAIYVSFANQVITYENEILNDNSITSIEKSILLSAHPVARHSCGYWFNYYNNPPLLESGATNTAARASWFTGKIVWEMM